MSIQFKSPLRTQRRSSVPLPRNLARIAGRVDTSLMSAEEEVELAARYRQTGDAALLDRFVLSHLPLAYREARRFSRMGSNRDDLEQEAVAALVAAAQRFDPAQGTRFATFAAYWIFAAMTDAVRRDRGAIQIKLTSEQRAALARYPRVRALWEQKAGREIDSAGREEIARHLGLSVEALAGVEAWLSGVTSSLDAPLGEDGGRLDEVVPDQAAGPEDKFLNAEASSVLKQALKNGLDLLNPRSRRIVEARWLMEPGLTLEELGREFSLSKERIRQIEEAALEKIQGSLKRKAPGIRSALAALSLGG